MGGSNGSAWMRGRRASARACLPHSQALHDVDVPVQHVDTSSEIRLQDDIDALSEVTAARSSSVKVAFSSQ